jgi:hypothetical protein
MKIAIYLSAIPRNKSETKLAVLKRFGEGVLKSSDQVEFVNGADLVDCDVAVMQGYVHKDINPPHLQLRKRILDNHKNVIVIDSNLFQFANAELTNYYLRYSLNGIFPTTGFYFDNKIDESRWQSISNRLNIELKNYRTTGDHILVCLQRVDGWSMCGLSVQEWLDNTVNEIRKYSSRPIIVRKHPGDRRQEQLQFSNQYTISTTPKLVDDLENCWATITYNSSPGIASLIHGVPVFVTDIEPKQSQTWPVCNTDLRLIETPIMHDRTDWINKISQSHWNDDEVASGQAWQFIRERLCILTPNLY